MNRKVYTNPEDFFRQNEALDTDLPYAEDVSVLSAPLQVGNKTIRNRLPVRLWRAATAHFPASRMC